MTIRSAHSSLDRMSERSCVRLLGNSVLRGCNRHHAGTVVEQRLDLGLLSGRHTGDAGAEFAQRYLALFEGLGKCLPNRTSDAAFLTRLASTQGATFGEALLQAVLYVEAAMAYEMFDLRPVEFARIVEGQAARHYILVWSTHATGISRRVPAVALAGLRECLPESLCPPGDAAATNFETALAALQAEAKERESSATTSVLMLAAQRRGIPCESLGGAHLRLGHGAAQRMIYASIPGETSLQAAQLCRNKRRSNRYLQKLNLPVPHQMTAGSVEAALEAAEQIGYPVVIKPLRGKQGQGVTVGIAAPDDVPDALERAQLETPNVIVEAFIPGQVVRLLVMDGRFAAALKIEPPTVTGDGLHDIRSLIALLNEDPKRNDVILCKVAIDPELIHSLATRGYTLDTVLERGVTVALRSAANVAVGGIHTDVTDAVHPDNREMAIRAAAGLGLTLAGVDFVTPDVSRSHREVGGCIIELNARPALCMHAFPAHGHSRDVAGAMLDSSFPAGATGRIPTALVLGDRQTVAVARELDRMLRASGVVAGLATKRDTAIGGNREQLQGMHQRDALRTLLRDNRTEALITAVAPRRAIKHGLGLDVVDVVAILSSDNMDSGLYRETVELITRAAARIIVVAAENVEALAALRSVDPRRLVLVSFCERSAATDLQLASGGVVVQMLRRNGQELIALRRQDEVLATLPARDGAEAARRAEIRRFAAALAFAMGFPVGPPKDGSNAS